MDEALTTPFDLHEHYDSFKAKEHPFPDLVWLRPQYPALPTRSGHAVVPFGEFQARFTDFTCGAFTQFRWENVAVLGGSVVYSLLPEARPEPFEEADVDIFIYGVGETAFSQRVCKVVDDLRAAWEGTEVAVLRTPNTITLCGGWPRRNVQIILSLWPSLKGMLSTVDIDCTGVAYTGDRVWCTESARLAYVYRWSVPNNCSRSCRSSPSYEKRLVKYCARGFAIVDVLRHPEPLPEYRIPHPCTLLDLADLLPTTNIRVVLPDGRTHCLAFVSGEHAKPISSRTLGHGEVAPHLSHPAAICPPVLIDGEAVPFSAIHFLVTPLHFKHAACGYRLLRCVAASLLHLWRRESYLRCFANKVLAARLTSDIAYLILQFVISWDAGTIPCGPLWPLDSILLYVAGGRARKDSYPATEGSTPQIGKIDPADIAAFIDSRGVAAEGIPSVRTEAYLPDRPSGTYHDELAHLVRALLFAREELMHM